jgi:glycerate kinase
MDTVNKEVQHFRSSFDLGEIVKRAIKYLVEGLVVALAAFFIPQKKMDMGEITVIAFTAATTFALLDIFAPSIGSTTRAGAGYGIGLNLVGFPAM